MKHPENKSIMSVQIWFLKLVLMWPVSMDTFRRKICVYAYSAFISFSLCLSSLALLAQAMLTTDLVGRSESINMLTLTASAFFKYRYFMANYDVFCNFVRLLDEEFPQTPYFGDDNFTIEKWMKWSAPLSATHIIVGVIAMTFCASCPLMEYFFGSKSWEAMPLPINVWFPFDFTYGPVYWVLFVVHFFALLSSATIYLACDGFLFSVITFMNGQIEILKASLRGLDTIKDEGQGPVDTVRLNGFKKCVQLHTKILDYLKELDIVFRSMICADVLHAIISLSFAMFQATEARGVMEQLKMITFVVYCFFHQYLNSLFGQLLINQQENLMSDVYSVHWYKRSVSFQRSLHIMMGGGCLKPVKLSAWRMYFLQYETFVEFCRSMVSFFMVLRTLTEKGIIQSSSAQSAYLEQ